MPTLWAHRMYFRHLSTGVAPPPPTLAAGGGGYPIWQASVITPSLFGAVGPYLAGLWRRARWWVRLYRRFRDLDGERRAVLLRTLAVLEAPAYPLAQSAVRQTATTLGFSRPEAWQGLSRAMKASPGRAENTFRHLNAWTLTQEALRTSGSTLSGPLLHLVTELAYHGFAIRGR